MNFAHQQNKLINFVTQFTSCNIKRSLTFKSIQAVEYLHPNSNLRLVTPSKPANKDNLFSGYIPINELNITYSRSSGPGGQNVNTVNTKVDLRFNVQSASWINDEIKSKLMKKYESQITKDGFLVFRSDLTRSQQLNLADCLKKVRTVIRSLCVVNQEISQDTQERIRKRHERATQERLKMKHQRSQIKADRRSPTI